MNGQKNLSQVTGGRPGRIRNPFLQDLPETVPDPVPGCLQNYCKMSRKNHSPGDAEAFSVKRLILFLFSVSLIGLIVYRYYTEGGGLTGDYTHIPKEVLINYIPADFQGSFDAEKALPILSNPYRYSREFDELIYDFNLSLVEHVSNRMGLSDSLKNRVRQAYDEYHPMIEKMMFNDFTALKDSSSILYNTWYQTEHKTAAEMFNEVASKYTCFLINQVFSVVLKTDEGRIFVKGKKVDTPCGVAMAEGLKPMMERLKTRAAIADFNSSKGILNERIERSVSELGTMEIRDRKGIGTSRSTRILGFDVSSTEMEMSAISILKVGFRIDKFFDLTLDSGSSTVTVTLPEPEILSHEVFPKIDKLDVGWLREIDPEDFNKNMDLLRQEFRQEALESDIMDKAKDRAAGLMETILLPVLKGMDSRFRLQVRFRESGSRKPGQSEPVKNDLPG